MPTTSRLRSLLGSGPMLLLIGLGGVTTAVTLAQPSLSLPSASGGSITDSPKEVIDQVWQIVYRDFLDSSGTYTPDRWKQLRRDLLAKSYAGTGESYEAIRGMFQPQVSLYPVLGSEGI